MKIIDLMDNSLLYNIGESNVMDISDIIEFEKRDYRNNLILGIDLLSSLDEGWE